MKSFSVTIEMKALEQKFAALLFVFQHQVALLLSVWTKFAIV